MTPPHMHPDVTIIHATLLLVTSWAGLGTPLARPVLRRQSSSHSANGLWLHNGSHEASSRDMSLDDATPNFYSHISFSLPSPILTSANHRWSRRQQPVYRNESTRDTAAEADFWTTATSFRGIKATDRYYYRWDLRMWRRGRAIQCSSTLRQCPSIGGCDRICFIITSRPAPWIHDGFTV